MKILAIESTCDETSVALAEGSREGVIVTKNLVASSSEMHSKYGGIVPEVAAREQIKAILPLLEEVVAPDDIGTLDAVAVSYGPGLVGSLLIGIETAKVLAACWKKPLIKVNHMMGHIAANWIVEKIGDKVPQLPAVALTISGGHTDFFMINDFNSIKWIGGTLDDAAGEAFDKVARILSLPYPGGPSIQKIAESLPFSKRRRVLPRPMIRENSLHVSFSGLKAAVMKELTKNNVDPQMLAADFNDSVAEVLCAKLGLAMDQNKPKSVIVAGGVSANSIIRSLIEKEVTEHNRADLFIPELKYCGDNAAMIGVAAILFPDYIDPSKLSPNPGLS